MYERGRRQVAVEMRYWRDGENWSLQGGGRAETAKTLSNVNMYQMSRIDAYVGERHMACKC
jgi:hypothetical protein